jgi:hypothetical protein
MKPETRNKKQNTRNQQSLSRFLAWSWVWGFLFLVSCFWFLPGSRAQEGSPIQDTDELRDITGIEAVPPAPAVSLWPYGLALGFFLACSLFFVGRKYLRKTQPRSEPAPDHWALAELDRLDSLNLPEAGQVERYHTLTSGVLRNYLEARFHLPASRQTTPEFLQTVRDSPFLPAPHQEALRAFLVQCDLAKFARVHYSPEECRTAGQMARRLVQETSAMTNHQQEPAGKNQGSGIRSQESEVRGQNQ